MVAITLQLCCSGSTKEIKQRGQKGGREVVERGREGAERGREVAERGRGQKGGGEGAERGREVAESVAIEKYGREADSHIVHDLLVTCVLYLKG